MKILTDFSLKDFNTFGIDAKAKEFISVHSVEELKAVLQQNKEKEKFILSGGSNMLLTKDISALVIHINFLGKEIVSETKDHVRVKCNAGENWHQFVLYTLENNFGGLENLSLIPGNVGTTPIQNIGAYGVEIKDHMISCEAINIETFESKIFSTKDCEFGYRESIFKSEYKNQYIITSVTFELTKNNHLIRTNYGDITNELSSKGITDPSIKDVSNAVISIRQTKLPDPKEIGNSGSFFKNPIISKDRFENIKKNHPEIKFYEISDTEVKIPAGWLIEQVGLKGFRNGDAGVHKNQALVLVNYGKATGQEILQLSQQIQQKVLEKFDIEIAAEVNII